MKEILYILIISITLTFSAFSAGSGGSSNSDSGGGNAKSNYEKAVNHIKWAKKYEKKPNKPDTLNYLGFTTRKLGDFENGEKYYLQGLAIDPKHIGINEYLGELYVATGRHNLAIERLEVLKGCGCEEYDELKAIIAGEKVSKY